jgi:hypothetical protein
MNSRRCSLRTISLNQPEALTAVGKVALPPSRARSELTLFEVQGCMARKVQGGHRGPPFLQTYTKDRPPYRTTRAAPVSRTG